MVSRTKHSRTGSSPCPHRARDTLPCRAPSVGDAGGQGRSLPPCRRRSSWRHVHGLFPYKLYILEIQTTGLSENRSTVLKLSNTLINFEILSDGQCVMERHRPSMLPSQQCRRLQSLLGKLLPEDTITHSVSPPEMRLLQQVQAEFLYFRNYWCPAGIL